MVKKEFVPRCFSATFKASELYDGQPMIFKFKSWWRKRIVRRKSIDDALWQHCIQRLPLLRQFNDEEITRLRELATLFLYYKSIEATADLELTHEMRVVIAAQACIPILNLGIDWYAGWVSVIVYPQGFTPTRTQTDESGVVHEQLMSLGGEAWHRGPVILSWSDTAYAGEIDGHNLVIHEFAHKLDMRNGAANGFPPLHAHMSFEKWTKAFSQAYEDLLFKVEHNLPTPFNRYGASAPAEFFAVLSEVFFELPQMLETQYPAVFCQLCEFYRQHPRLIA